MGKVRYYTDEHVAKAVIRGFRATGHRRIDHLKQIRWDEEHLAFALVEGRVIFIQDGDFLRLASGTLMPASSTILKKRPSARLFRT